MDISDKNTEGYIQYNDPSYIKKLQQNDKAVNKIIDEFLKTQFNTHGSQSNITDGINSLITHSLSGGGSGGYGTPAAGVVWGDGLAFDSGTGVISLAGETPITPNFVLHIGTDSGAYGSNTQNTDSIWTSEFGSITPSVIPMGGVDSSYEFTSLATTVDSDFVYVVFQGVHYQDFFSAITLTGLLSDNQHTVDATSYFVTDLNGMFQTFWKWSIPNVGNWYSTGDRDIGIAFNSLYQQPATNETYSFSPSSLYAWTGFPDVAMTSDYQSRLAEGGKMNISAAYASPIWPSSGTPFTDPVIFGKHNGICAGPVENSTGDNWFMLLLGNSDGTENYQITSTCLSTPLNTVDAVYELLDPSITPWGQKAFFWNVATVFWGGVGFSEFTLTNLD